jgi:copper(I)-binding protein
MKPPSIVVAACLAVGLSAPLFAQSVEVSGVWARATVPGQRATGAFMHLMAKNGARLVAASTPVAGLAEVHEMKLEEGVMRMRALPGGLELPAGKMVELKPGGFHLMLLDLKQPLPKESTLALTLVFQDAKGVETRTELKVPVGMQPPALLPPAAQPPTDAGAATKP